jgi:geranylgeranyl pyrophosphate synthase
MPAKSDAEKAQALFYQKSIQAHTLAKQEILSQKVGLKKQDRAVAQYLSLWNDSIRQGIASIAFEAIGGKLENVVPLQVALSFIDVTMDIHDDIIDDSMKKKGTKTMYGKIGKASTLLIGDVFLVKGFHLLHRAIENLSKEQQSQIMDTVNSFLAEVVKAHITETDLQSKKWKVKPQVYLGILTQKAAEIEGRMKIAGIYGGANQKQIQALSKYGRILGILLAVRAEYTDLFEPIELSNRVKNECLPLHILYGLQKKAYKEKIFSLLSKSSPTQKDSEELLQILKETGTLASLKNQLKSLQKEAEDTLSQLPNNKEKEHLKLIITSMLEDM